MRRLQDSTPARVKGDSPSSSPACAPAASGQQGGSAASSEAISQQAKEFAAQWIIQRQGSPAELIQGLEEHVGWPARHLILSILDDLRSTRDLPDLDRKYLNYTLSHGAVSAALAEGLNPSATYQSSLDELFARSRQFRRSQKFAEAVEFVSKFQDYSPFNNMLVYLQNPLTTYFATSSHWYKAFRRTIKDEARGMIILAPRTPVLLVYDIADTEGPPLPDKLNVFTRSSGRFDPMILERTLKNCARDKIQIERKPMGQLRGGFATSRVRDRTWKMRIALREELSDGDAYSVLCHELAHIYLGHLGTDKDNWWPYRFNVPHAVAEIEAEAVAHIVCSRARLRIHSAEYLSSFVEETADLQSISLDLVSRTAARIEEMGKRLLPSRKEPTIAPFDPQP